MPESFGNTEHVLAPGVVCDGCNNYLAREVEKPILDSLYFKVRRFNAVVRNKRGHVVPLDGFHQQSGTRIQAYADTSEGISIGTHPATPPEERALARFVGKVGLEALAYRFIQTGKSHEELVDMPAFDEIRNFIRRGSGPPQWSVARRQLYQPGKVFADGEEHYELLHEYELLIRPIDEANDLYACYISLVLFGEEFVLNMGSPGLDDFEVWRTGDEV